VDIRRAVTDVALRGQRTILLGLPNGPVPNNIIVMAGMAAAVGAILTFCLRLIASQITKLYLAFVII
jgi:hypothetical protein